MVTALTSAVYWTANAKDADNHLTQQTLGNGLVTNHAFSAQSGRLSGIQTGSGNAIQNLAYLYDAIGNVSRRQDVNQSLTARCPVHNSHSSHCVYRESFQDRYPF